MEATITQTYDRLWHDHWWWQIRREIVCDAAREALARGQADREPDQTPRLFEIGCSGGHSFEMLSQFGSIQGVEPDPIMIGEDNRWREQIAVGGFHRHYPCDEPFDLILALDVLEHIEDDHGCVQRAKEMLAPGGRLLVTVPALPALWSLHDVAHHHFRRYTRRTLTALLRGAGLHIERMRYCYGWSLPLVWLRRWVARGDATRYQVSIPPRVVNSLCYGMTRVEETIARWTGLTPLLGSTLLAVAAAGETKRSLARRR